jgi:hypothetical protein
LWSGIEAIMNILLLAIGLVLSEPCFALSKTTYYTASVTGTPHYDVLQKVRLNHKERRGQNRVYCRMWLKERVDTENGYRIRVDWFSPARRPCNNTSRYPAFQGPGMTFSFMTWAKMIVRPDGKKDELKCRGKWRVRIVLEEPGDTETVLWKTRFRVR